MPPAGRLTRLTFRGRTATGLRTLVPPAVYGLTGLALRGVELGVLPAPPRFLGEFAIRTALWVNDAVLNWTNTDPGEDENTRPWVSWRRPDTGDNDGMSLGEVTFQPGEGEMGGGTAADGAVPDGTGAGPAVDLPHDRYLDREESWLRFNQRVLELAEDETVPLLERVRFLAIFASNLDEFFMVRVAGRIRRMATGLPVEGDHRAVAGPGAGEHPGHGPGAQPAARRVLQRHGPPALADEGIEILRWKELSADEQEDLQQLFRDRIYPVLTPLVVDPAHPFPYISGLSLSLAVMIADAARPARPCSPGSRCRRCCPGS